MRVNPKTKWTTQGEDIIEQIEGVSLDSYNARVCRMYRSQSPRGRSRAKLITMMPELLKALQDIQLIAEDGTKPSFHRMSDILEICQRILPQPNEHDEKH